ncbi:MAG: hypothetical protein ACW964_18585 [Candidatus Hodarchaeales archaeon]|jgi:hypothetical protein
MTMKQKKERITQTRCPLCAQEESVHLTEAEILKSKQEHKLIPKAFIHREEGHILALFIDIEGKVRRRFCFDIVEKITPFRRTQTTENLESIFTQMIQNSRKMKQIIHNLSEIEISQK